MAKISPVSIKYIIYAKFYATGTVERPDVIGAVFGQTEGLLGSELELRELQKEGKIGRIEVDVETKEGQTTGEIRIPTSLDKAETTIIAAALETIERIGPSDSKIEVEKIEDVRSNKRDYIINRAKKLLEDINSSTPETGELESAVKVSTRLSQLQEYGRESLPAGDLSGDEIIVAEGRADVLNLLKHGVKNVIGMNGTILPDTIKEIAQEKIVTLFIDGDRGGLLIAKNVTDSANINYIAVAPAGKEVEELSGKEILACLRKKESAEEFLMRHMRRREGWKFQKQKWQSVADKETTEEIRAGEKIGLTETEREQFASLFSDLTGSRGAYLLDSELSIIKKVPSLDIVNAINYARSVYAVIIDGTATLGIIKAAERKRCRYIVARNFAATSDSVKLLSF